MTADNNDIINIGHERLCECKKGYLSCIEAREWMKNQIGVWQFTYEPRDIRDKNVHPAVFPLAMAKRVIEQFTHKGELVLDPFVRCLISLGAGRGFEGTTQRGKGEVRELTFPLSPLGFSLELPFPHSLSPLVPLRFC